MMRNKLLIFDLDGTLLNTIEDLRNSVNYALKLHNYPERTIEQIRKSVGNGFAKLVSTSLPSDADNVETVLKVAKSHYGENFCIFSHPYAGIFPMLEKLKDEGYGLAIVSNKPNEMIQSLYHKFFADFFPFATGEIPGIPRKPSPELVYRAIEYFNADKAHTLYIGDSEVDYETAQNAGISSIIVNWGFRTAEELQFWGITDTVDTPEQLMARIR